jgi:selenocysteine-specific elongation factor
MSNSWLHCTAFLTNHMRADGSEVDSRVVATAGHVDHGKSTLVRTLTGTDPDRWAEEKARGLTIDLGFAHTTLPSGVGLSFVDVPGHIRFLRNMLAGVGAVDACLFVVAATEGWKEQSEEHLRITQLLGIRHGIVALTKVGIVDDEWRQLARLDVEDRVAGTFLEGAPIIDVDSPTGRGIDELREALDTLLATLHAPENIERPRLWVDRVFAAKGSGTIVTGTLTCGSLNVDDHVELIGSRATRSARIRSLQSHGAARSTVGPGSRVAVNLVGVGHDEVERGDALVRPGEWFSTRRFDAELSVLGSLDHVVSRRGAYAVHVGSGEHPTKVRILATTALEPGATGAVRLHLPHALPLLPGDRFVLREYGREETVGGGVALDVEPVRAASKANPTADITAFVAERRWVRLDTLRTHTREAWTGRVVGGWAVDEVALAADTERVLAAVDAAGALGLDAAALDERERLLVTELLSEELRFEGNHVVRVERVDPLADHAFVRALIDGGFSPPDATGVDRAELRELIRRRLVIEQDGIWFAPSTIDDAAHRVALLLAAQPDGITVSEIREALGTSRKYALPLLAVLDGTGVLRRRGDLRIGGPRLPSS